MSFAHPAQDIAFAEYRQAVREAHERVERVTEALATQAALAREAAGCGTDEPARDRLRGRRNVRAEIGDSRRFAHPRELMGFLGLVPSEYSTGETRRQGEITKTGNGHARRVLVEAAWNYRFPARISRVLQVRQEGQPKAVREIAWRAQLRLAPVSAPPGARPAPKSRLRGNRP